MKRALAVPVLIGVTVIVRDSSFGIGFLLFQSKLTNKGLNS